MSAVDSTARGLVLQGRNVLAGPGGAHTVGTVDGASVGDKVVDLPRSVRGQPGVTFVWAPGELRTANRAALQAAFSPGLDDARSREVLLPGGTFEIDGGITYNEGWETHSRLFRGSGAGYGSVTHLQGSDAYMFRIGDGAFEAFAIYMRDHHWDGQNNVTSAIGRYDVGNFLYWDNLRLVNFTGATGLCLTARKPGGGIPLMQEIGGTRMHFMCNGGGYGRIALDMELTGNADFFLNNYETCDTAVKVRGKNALASHREFGGHIERVSTWALDAQDATLFWHKEVTEGGIWLGNGVVGSTIAFSDPGNNGDHAASGAVIDNGFGNRVARTGILTGKSGSDVLSLAMQGHQQDGLEWLRAPGYNPYPLFEDGGASWTATGCVATSVPNPIMHPDLKGAGAARLTATQPGATFERAFQVETGLDQLGLVGLQFSRSTATATVSLVDGTGAVLASKVVNGMDADRSDCFTNVFRVAKVLATHSQVVASALRLRITLAASGDQVLCFLADIKPSESKHEAHVANSDSSSGANAAKRYRRTLVSTAMILNSGTAWPNGVGMIARGLIDKVAGGESPGFLGVGGTYNTATQRMNQRLPGETGEREYTAFVPKEVTGVVGSKLALNSFSGASDTVELSETSTHLVFPQVGHAQIHGQIGEEGVISRTYASAPRPRTLWMPFNGSQFLLEGASLRLLMNAPISAGATSYWRLDIYSKNGGGGDVPLLSWTTQSSGWTTGAILSLGNADFAASRRLLNGSMSLGLKLTRVNSPAEDFDGTACVLVQGRLWQAAGR